MGAVRKTIILTSEQEAWVKAQVVAGGYADDSEFFSDLIRREQQRGAEVEAIRHALIEGEASGEPKPFDVNAFKQRMLNEHG